MDYPVFLSSLFSDGRLVAPPVAPLGDDQLAAGDAVLADAERSRRMDMPGRAPEFSLPPARWSAVQLFRACQFAVYRDLDEATMDELLNVDCPAAPAPPTHYSVDLVFRYLPSLAMFAASAAENDPLIEHLRRWGREWPLSSAGMPGVENVNIDGFATDRCLLRLYADRIIAAGDISRLIDPRAAGAVRAALGAHSQLSAKISKALDELAAATTSS